MCFCITSKANGCARKLLARVLRSIPLRHDSHFCRYARHTGKRLGNQDWRHIFHFNSLGSESGSLEHALLSCMLKPMGNPYDSQGSGECADALDHLMISVGRLTHFQSMLFTCSPALRSFPKIIDRKGVPFVSPSICLPLFTKKLVVLSVHLGQ